MKSKKKIGLIGCGTIGQQLARAIKEHFRELAELGAICDLDQNKTQQLKEELHLDCPILSVEKLIAGCDLIIEAAAAEVAAEIAQQALENNKDVMVMSVGGLLPRATELFKLAKNQDRRLYVPSGALGGLDAVSAAAMSKIDKATLVTRKPPSGLKGAPYFKQHNLDLGQIKEETVIFDGTAAEAVEGFPKNVNVCAALSLAGIGAEKTTVKIITSPEFKFNTHQVELEGDFGKLLSRTENRPSPDNPKTSFLAALSAIATLKNILNVVKIGT
ncbi:aspartate dehydrogenase [Candidatus Omnitrophota bacterium]